MTPFGKQLEYARPLVLASYSRQLGNFVRSY